MKLNYIKNIDEFSKLTYQLKQKIIVVNDILKEYYYLPSADGLLNKYINYFGEYEMYFSNIEDMILVTQFVNSDKNV